ncbi:methyl viologen-reducing hydrogenase [Archaeoglobales archaeon]|nr:MAG: methyl viologen-reducing hydrogenase [Archaeoglobales archaeon]
MTIRIAEEWLAKCGGCEVTILDVGEAILDLLPKIEFVHMPVIMDHKYYGQTGERAEIEIPEADIGIIAGGIRNEEHREVAKIMREKCKIIIALGSCACFGGIPALGNMFKLDEIYDKVYRGTKSTEPGDAPSVDLPHLTDRVYAIDEEIKVDVYLPGCPTHYSHIAEALTALIEGKPFKLAERSVCDDCPLIREKKAVATIRRNLEPLDYDPTKLDKTRCLMEQGILCLGPVTRAGCGGPDKTPRCISVGIPCEGCFGPIRPGANPMVEMMGALSSIGLDPKQVLDRRATLQRFIGAHNRLRPLPTR